MLLRIDDWRQLPYEERAVKGFPCPVRRKKADMSDLILPGDPPIALCLRRSAAARRISLRVSQLDGRVTLTLPKALRQAEALAFAQEKEPWIRKHLAARGQDVPVEIGAELMIGGQMYQVQSGAGRKIVLTDGVVQVPGPLAQAGVRLGAHLREQARIQLTESADFYAARLGRGYSRLALRDTRSRWGSCSSDGRLMFSWRLILAPPTVLNYVAAHEVAHLAEMNHSPAFWHRVQTLFGDYGAARSWLQHSGRDLHRFRFP